MYRANIIMDAILPTVHRRRCISCRNVFTFPLFPAESDATNVTSEIDSAGIRLDIATAKVLVRSAKSAKLKSDLKEAMKAGAQQVRKLSAKLKSDLK
jgi:hypothetical protein